MYIYTRNVKKTVSKALWDFPKERHQIKQVITKKKSQVFQLLYPCRYPLEVSLFRW